MWRPEPGQRGIMGGAEQLPLFDSPVSGMVLAPHRGAQQECNRPDQLRQCRDHCYSDLGFLLPVTTSRRWGWRSLAIAQSPPLNGTAPRQEYRCPGAVPWRQHYRRTVYGHFWPGCETGAVTNSRYVDPSCVTCTKADILGS